MEISSRRMSLCNLLSFWVIYFPTPRAPQGAFFMFFVFSKPRIVKKRHENKDFCKIRCVISKKMLIFANVLS